MFSSSSTSSARSGSAISSLRPLPGAAAGGDVAGPVLGLPGEALAHAVPRDQVAEAFQRATLAGRPGALDELHDRSPPPVAEHAQHQPEGGRGLALARPGVDHQQALLHGSCPRPRRPAPPCAWPSWRGGVRPRRRWRFRVRSFHPHRQSGDQEQHTCRPARRNAGCSRPAASRNARASALSGTMPSPTSLLTSTVGAAAPVQRRIQRLRRGGDVVVRQHQVAQPQRQAIHQHRPLASLRQRARQVERLLHRRPSPRPAAPDGSRSARAFRRRTPARWRHRPTAAAAPSITPRRAGSCRNARRRASGVRRAALGHLNSFDGGGHRA